MQRGFTKLFNTIVTSTIWQEDDKTRIVWITMLAIADADGIVSASIPGLANVSKVAIAAARRAIEKLLDKDPDSRTKDYDGRRIETIDGGWRILNYQKYRRMLNEEERREYKARWIAEKRRQVSTPRRHKSSKSTQAEAEAEEKKKAAPVKPVQPFNVEDWLTELEKDETYKGINIRVEFGKCRTWCNVRGLTLSKRRFVNWINRAEKPISSNGAAKVTYKRNYMPPAREPTAEEIEKARAIAKAEADKFRASQGRSP